MKNHSYFLIAIMLLGMMSCDRTSVKPSDCEMALLDKGKIVFYDANSNKSLAYMAETDSVINAEYADEHTFYYTVSNQKGLQLKRLDLQQPDPKPVFCIDWNLTLDDCTDEIRGYASMLIVSEDRNYVGIMKEYSWDVYGLTKIVLYERNTGKVLEYDYEDDRFSDLVFIKDKIVHRSFDSDEGEFYFYNTEGENCLTDQLDFAGYFGVDPEELEDLDYYAVSFTPIGEWVLFSASMPWGDFGYGPYCVATWNGEKQMILDGTDITDREPEWLKDGSLVFISADQLPESSPEYESYHMGRKPCVSLMAPNGKIKIISHANDFVVKPYEIEQ